MTSESRRRLSKTLHLASGQAERGTVHNRFVTDVEVVESGRAVDREPLPTGADDADCPAAAFGVRAKGTERFGALRFGPDGIGRHQRDAAVDGVCNERVAEEEELFIVAQGEVIESPSAVSAHDLSRAQLG